MNNEIWKRLVINGEKTRYNISNYGNIININTGKNISKYMAFGKIKVSIYVPPREKTGTTFPVDMLVLETFKNISKKNGYVVYYKDRNSTNLNVENLDYITEDENLKRLTENIFEHIDDYYVIKDDNLHKDEIWKFIMINGDMTKYMISNYGNIFNVLSGLYLHPTIGTHGYPFITIKHMKRQYKIQMHRIVAEYFVENPYPKLYDIVHHKNHNKTDFKASNLEWTSQSKNILYSYDEKSAKRGEESINATITAADAQRICEMISNGYRISEIQRTIGCTRDVIRHIRDRETWKEISQYYSFDTSYKYFKNQKEIDSIKYLMRIGLTKAAVSRILNIPYTTVTEISNRQDYFIFNIKELIETNVINMYKYGYSINNISELTGLTKNRIKNIIDYYTDSIIEEP